MALSPQVGHTFCAGLVHKYKLKAVAVFNFNLDSAMGLTVCCFDSRGRDMLHEWASQFAKTIPESITGRLGSYILSIRDDGEMDCATWGKSRADCQAIGDWAKTAFDQMSTVPFQTWFGVWNGGVPKRLSPTEFQSLTENQQMYVRQHTHPDAT